jgi:hypothetical protein
VRVGVEVMVGVSLGVRVSVGVWVGVAVHAAGRRCRPRRREPVGESAVARQS